MKNIVFIGFMGSGKIIIGKLIVEKFDIEFIDMDLEVIKEFGMIIDKIFEVYGEKKFREVEIKVIERVLKFENVVILIGGGVVLNFENVKFLRENGVIYFLYVFVESIFKRLKDDDIRFFLKSGDKFSNIIKFLNMRMLFYKNCDFEINIDIFILEFVVEKIILIYLVKESKR